MVAPNAECFETYLLPPEEEKMVPVKCALILNRKFKLSSIGLPTLLKCSLILLTTISTSYLTQLVLTRLSCGMCMGLITSTTTFTAWYLTFASGTTTLTTMLRFILFFALHHFAYFCHVLNLL